MSSSLPKKHYFYYGHRRPSQNRPIVHGGLFTNRKALPSNPHRPSPPPVSTVDFRHWDSSSASLQYPPSIPSPSTSFASRRLSPLARFISDLLRRHRHWCPALLSELAKLRRVSPDLVAEVLRSDPHPNPSLSTRFFHWASRQKGFHHSYSSFNAFAHSLYRSGHPRAADRVPDLMLALGKPPSEPQLELLVRLHSQSRRGLRLFHVYKRMTSIFNIRPRVFLYNRILDSLIRTDHLDLALSVYDDMIRNDVKEEPITFTILAKGLCKAGRITAALDLLEKMRRDVCKPDVFAYTAMVKVLAAQGNLDGCLEVWNQLKMDGVQPDVMAYATLISGLCKVGRVEKGMELFRDMKSKRLLIDRAVYGALIEGFVAEKKVGNGCELLKEMIDDGYRADLMHYNCLIHGLCEAGKDDKAYKLFQFAMQEELVPSFETVTPLLACYVDADERDRFFQLVDSISELGLSVMNHLSHFFRFFVGKGGRELQALQVFELLKQRSHTSVEIYNILIQSLYKIKDYKRALSLFEEMQGSEEFQPDSATYDIMIQCFVDDGDVREGACSCYNKMKEMSSTPSVAAYLCLVKGLCNIWEINAAITVVKDCLGNVENGPLKFKYTLTILNACRTGDPQKVIEILDEMIREGVVLEEIMYCAIIHGFFIG
ncbi:putative tetratricopeptide-like helical domain superfamily [Dioscorea sansibarensis]